MRDLALDDSQSRLLLTVIVSIGMSIDSVTAVLWRKI